MKKIVFFLCSIIVANAMQQNIRKQATRAPRNIYEAIHAEDETALRYYLGYEDADFSNWQHAAFSCRRTQITPLYAALQENKFTMARIIIFARSNVLGTGKLTTPIPWFGCYPSCAHRTWAVTKLADSCARLLAEKARTNQEARTLLSEIIATKKSLQTTYYYLKGKPRATALLAEHSHHVEELLYKELCSLENQTIVAAGMRNGLLSPAKLLCAAAQEDRPLPMGFATEQEPVTLDPYFGKRLLQQAEKLKNSFLSTIALRACPELARDHESLSKKHRNPSIGNKDARMALLTESSST